MDEHDPALARAEVRWLAQVIREQEALIISLKAQGRSTTVALRKLRDLRAKAAA